MIDRHPGWAFLLSVLFLMYAIITAGGEITTLFIVALTALVGVAAKLEIL